MTRIAAVAGTNQAVMPRNYTSWVTALRFNANLGWLFTDLPFEHRFEAAAGAGFAAVEYASPYEYSPHVLRKWLSDTGLQQILINTPTDPSIPAIASGLACLPGYRSQFRDGIRRALDYAIELDAHIVHVQGGIRPSGVSIDRAFATYVSNITWAVEQAAATAVTFVLEPINQRDAPGFVPGSYEQGAAVVEAIGPHHLGLLLDIYHCQIGGGDLARRLQTLMPLTSHIQIADVPHRNEPGTGEIAWDFVFDQISALGYAGWIGCEYRPATSAVPGLAWRQRFNQR